MPLRTKTQWWGTVLDSDDPRGLAHFYADLLGWQVFSEDEGGAAVAPSKDAGYNIATQLEPNYVKPVWPSVEGQPLMMLHLDIEVDDLAEAVAYALSVGAELPDFQPQDNVRVMLDPSGHPFCLYTDSSESDD